MVESPLNGPRVVKTLTCNGCPAYSAKDWDEWNPETDERERGRYARCTLAGQDIASYATRDAVTPRWCPMINDPVD